MTNVFNRSLLPFHSILIRWTPRENQKPYAQQKSANIYIYTYLRLRLAEFKCVPDITVVPFESPFTSVASQVHPINHASTNGSRTY